MILKDKNILIFGGESFLWNEMMKQFKESESNITWVNNSDFFGNSNLPGKKIIIDSLHSVHTYEDFFENESKNLASYDGVIFSLSEGSLRPLNMTKSIQVVTKFEINCMSFIELIRVLNKKKKINEGASILAFSSVSSLMGLKTKLAYAVSKAALNSAILNLASELSTKKIRVNGILKGALTTDFNYEHVKNMFTVGDDSAGKQELGMSTPDELANLSIFLLSDQIKTMTGTLIKLDGGYSLG